MEVFFVLYCYGIVFLPVVSPWNSLNRLWAWYTFSAFGSATLLCRGSASGAFADICTEEVAYSRALCWAFPWVVPAAFCFAAGERAQMCSTARAAEDLGLRSGKLTSAPVHPSECYTAEAL
jgi:hypothetical protein